LRVAIDAVDGDDAIDELPVQLRPDNAERFIRACIFLRENGRGEEQRSEQEFPHDERELWLRELSTGFSVAHLNAPRHAFNLQLA
jgi:hypothetical protein